MTNNKLPGWWKSDKPWIIGDCIGVMKGMPDECIDLVVTDPPYNIGDTNKITKKNGIVMSNKECWGEWDNYDYDEYLKYIFEVMKEFDRILKKSGSTVIFYDKFYMTYLHDFGKSIGWHPSNFYAIVKNQPLPHIRMSGFRSGFELAVIFNKNKDKRKFNFLEQKEMNNYYKYNNTMHETEHPTEKPLEPFIRFVKIFTDESNIVFDPFLGSGTTLKACRLTDRIGLGCEINPDYEEIIRNRSMDDIEGIDKFLE